VQALSTVRTVKLVLAYDGTGYVGWQRQATGVSIQALVERAIEPVEGRAVNVFGAGRTDAGVHAVGQVASVKLSTSIDVAALGRALNATLPPDVRVYQAADAEPDFHARFSAKSKVYRYQIRNAPAASPFEHRYVWHVPRPLDIDAMARAAAPLGGRHDFASFQATGSDATSTERTVLNVRVEAAAPVTGAAADPPLIVIEMEADGFLRHMVRSVVGTLTEVGLGRRPEADLASVLEARDRRRAGPTAPAHGLFLVRVVY